MQFSELSDVQRCNLTVALCIREAVLTDPAAACCRFDLSADQLSAFRSLTPDEILSSITALGHHAVFSLRADLAALLRRPSPLAALVAAAQPRAKMPVSSSVVRAA